MVVSLTATQNSWVQILVPVKTLFLIEDRVQVKALFPKLGPGLNWRAFFKNNFLSQLTKYFDFGWRKLDYCKINKTFVGQWQELTIFDSRK